VDRRADVGEARKEDASRRAAVGVGLGREDASNRAEVGVWLGRGCETKTSESNKKNSGPDATV
jgi:hypothetical protein